LWRYRRLGPSCWGLGDAGAAGPGTILKEPLT
jgi:hypothetical protein